MEKGNQQQQLHLSAKQVEVGNMNLHFHLNLYHHRTKWNKNEKLGNKRKKNNRKVWNSQTLEAFHLDREAIQGDQKMATPW